MVRAVGLGDGKDSQLICLLVAAREGDAHPLGALPIGTLINNLESEPGRGAQYIRAAGMKLRLCGIR